MMRRPGGGHSGLEVARAMMMLAGMLSLGVVALWLMQPNMSRGFAPSPWLDVPQPVGMAGLLVAMVWMLATWRAIVAQL
jgi:hypothetical protein